MLDKINISIVMILRGNMKRLRLQLEAGEECDDDDESRILGELCDEASMLASALNQRLIDRGLDAAEEFLTAAEGTT